MPTNPTDLRHARALLVWGLLGLTLAGGAAATAAPSASPSSLRWERVPLRTPGDAPTALVLDVTAGRIAVGASRGALVGSVDGALQRVLSRGPVTDVGFLPSGGLLAATLAGLYRVDAAGDAQRVAVGAGEGARRIRRLGLGDALFAVATAAGVHAARPGGRSVVGGELWTLTVNDAGPIGVAGPARRVRVPSASRDGGPLDLAFDLPGADAVVVLPSVLVVRPTPESDWEVLRPSLPPGASARRIAYALGRHWLATDGGLLEATHLSGPWRRAPPPAGSAEVRAIAGDAASLHVATAEGLLRATTVGSTPAPTAVNRPPPADPDIAVVHRVALAYLNLGPEQIGALRDGVTQRGWLPTVAFHVGQDRSWSWREDYDQTVSSGETHNLFDEEFDRDRDVEFGLTLAWDLGDTLYHPESIDVSREARAVIELRDDVLDEVTQLYFERRRVLAELVALPPSTAGPAAGSAATPACRDGRFGSREGPGAPSTCDVWSRRRSLRARPGPRGRGPGAGAGAGRGCPCEWEPRRARTRPPGLSMGARYEVRICAQLPSSGLFSRYAVGRRVEECPAGTHDVLYAGQSSDPKRSRGEGVPTSRPGFLW
jgi:hypothetical protein